MKALLLASVFRCFGSTGSTNPNNHVGSGPDSSHLFPNQREIWGLQPKLGCGAGSGAGRAHSGFAGRFGARAGFGSSDQAPGACQMATVSANLVFTTPELQPPTNCSKKVPGDPTRPKSIFQGPLYALGPGFGKTAVQCHPTPEHTLFSPHSATTHELLKMSSRSFAQIQMHLSEAS